ncbi:MAG: aminotransferase class I/II-fold pyridoxal phosphate-dependent enzyme [Crocinitomicaceae bacterium]|nr:aminotransferase class I/II-fold pyridoxal phosphate-dependent enzyme [Crocinitomicaceae bacterium]
MSKLPNIGTNIFSVMSKLANETGAINLSQGFPNFPVDTKLTDIIKQKADQNVHQYTPMPGSGELLAAVSGLIEKSYKRQVDTNLELLISAGATQGIFTTIMALIETGDEVIILDPSYDCYEPSVLLAGGTPVRVPLDLNFMPDWDLIESKTNSKTKLIITNNPHNPSGRVWSESDFEALETLVSKNDQMLVLSDEVYEFITFDQKHISANEREKLKNRSIITSSFGKSFHITGWKIGYVVAPEHLMAEIKKVHQFNVFSVNSVAQACLAEYISQTDVFILGEFYKEKRNLFQQLLSDSNFKLAPCQGTYFQVADYSAISSESDVAFSKTLTIKYGVASIPVSVFSANGQDDRKIRFCFAKDNDTLIKAANKLCKI